MSLNMLYHRLRDVKTSVLLVVKAQEGFVSEPAIYTVSSGTYFRIDHNYNKILKFDCLSTDGEIEQCCLSNWTVRAITRAHLNSFVFTASKKLSEFLVF